MEINPFKGLLTLIKNIIWKVNLTFQVLTIVATVLCISTSLRMHSLVKYTTPLVSQNFKVPCHPSILLTEKLLLLPKLQVNGNLEKKVKKLY